MTYYTRESSLEIAILDLSCTYSSISAPYSFSGAVGNLSLAISGSDNEQLTLNHGRYVLYSVPYCTTTAAVSYSLQSNQSGAFSNIGAVGTIPITGDGTGQNSAAVASLTVHEPIQIKLIMTALGGSATDSGGYIRISRAPL